MFEKNYLSLEDFQKVSRKEAFKELLVQKNVPMERVWTKLNYLEDLQFLQMELVKLQQWVAKNNKRVAVIFEGRDAAGKGGSIRRFI